MSHKIRISVVIVLIIMTILMIVFWQQRSTARQQLALTELTHATTVAEVQATMTAQIRAQETVQAESKIALATAVSKIDLQESRQAEADAHIQEVEEQYQSALAQKLGAQAQLRLDDTVDPTLGTLLATESLQRFQSIEGDIAIRRGIELMSWRQVFTASNQGECVRSISLSADGQRLGTLSSSCRYETERVEVKVWDVNTNQEIVRLVPDHDELPVREVSLSPDGHWLVIHQWGNYHTIKVIDLDASQQVTQTISSDWAFSPDSQQLALISNDNTVAIWDISTQKLLTSLAHDQKVLGVDYSPDGRWIVTYGEDKTWLWDASNNELTHEIAIKDARIHFSQDGHSLAIIDRSDSIVHLWEVDTWQEIAQVGYGLSIYEVEFSPDGRWLATLSSKGNVQIWETSSGTEVNRISLGSNSTSTMTFSPDGRWLATSSAAGKIQLWETNTWRESVRIPQGGSLLDFSTDSNLLASNTKVWKLGPGPEMAKFSTDDEGKFGKVLFSPNGQWVATVQKSEEKNSIRLWDISTFQETMEFEHDNARLIYFTFNPTSQQIVAIDDTGIIFTWDVITGQEISQINFGETDLGTLIFSPNAQWMISTSRLTPSIKIWEVATGQEIGRISDFERFTLQNITFSPDSRWIAVGTYSGTVLWDVQTHQEVCHLTVETSIDEARAVAFSPDGRLLAVGGVSQAEMGLLGYKKVVRIWDVTKCQEIKQLPHTYTIAKVAFSSDGQLLAVGTNQIGNDWKAFGETRIWNIATGKEVALIDSGQVLSLFFNPDDRWVFVNGSIWEVRVERKVARIQGFFSPDGRWLATSGDDYISIWAWHPADLIAQACDRLSRNLTKQEWHQYIGDEPYRATCPNLPMQK